MIRPLVLGAAVIFVSAPLLGEPEAVVIKTGFLTGNDFQRLGAAEKRFYLLGYVDGVLVAPLFKAPKSETGYFETCVTGMTDEQVTAVVSRYLSDHPARWHESMNVLSYSAFKEACGRSDL